MFLGVFIYFLEGINMNEYIQNKYFLYSMIFLGLILSILAVYILYFKCNNKSSAFYDFNELIKLNIRSDFNSNMSDTYLTVDLIGSTPKHFDFPSIEGLQINQVTFDSRQTVHIVHGILPNVEQLDKYRIIYFKQSIGLKNVDVIFILIYPNTRAIKQKALYLIYKQPKTVLDAENKKECYSNLDSTQINKLFVFNNESIIYHKNISEITLNYNFPLNSLDYDFFKYIKIGSVNLESYMLKPKLIF